MQRSMAAALAVVATIGLGLFGPSHAAATPGYTCTYNAFTAEVTVTLQGAWPQISRDTAGHILVNSTWCGTAATVTNTNTIVVNGTSNNDGVGILLSNGGFAPGWANEPGGSDEIEFKINLGGGALDQVEIIGTSGVDRIDLGEKNTATGLVRRINLNSGESTGVDSDVTLRGVEKVGIYGMGDNDVIRGRGLRASGPDPITLPLNLFGGPGNDIIKGGNAGDYLMGDAGTDRIWGYGGADQILMVDGAPGDAGYGGPGVDTWSGDSGDTWTQ